MPEFTDDRMDDDLRPCPGGECPMRLNCWRYTERESNRRPLLRAPPFYHGQHGPHCWVFLEARGGPWLTPLWGGRGPSK